MAILTTAQLYDLAQRHGAIPGALECIVAGALNESGGNTDAVGDNGHSLGLWQLNDQGLGAGMSAAERCDPDRAAAVMVPIYVAQYLKGQQRGFDGETLAKWTYMASEMPLGWRGEDNPGLDSAAANRFAGFWRDLGQQPPAPPIDHSAILTEARTWLGVEYRWGGQDRNGIDCSGLVIEVLKAVGLWPWGDDTAAGIANRFGLSQDWDSIHDGDLLFFDWEDGQGIAHIGFRDGYQHTLDAQQPGTVVRERALSAWEVDHLAGFACPGATPDPEPPPDPEPTPDPAPQPDADTAYTLAQECIRVLDEARYRTRATDPEAAWSQVGSIVDYLHRIADLTQPAEGDG